MNRIIPLILLASLALAQAPQRINGVIEKIEKGQPIIGVSPQDLSLTNAAVLADSPLDFLVIDMEHAPVDFEQLRAFLQGMVSRSEVLQNGSLRPNVVPFLSLPQNGREQLQFMIKQGLDIGVYGLMFAHINTAQEAEAAIQASRYPQAKGAADYHPIGLRGVSPLIAARYWGLSMRDYIERADIWPIDRRGEIFLFIQIEEAEGVANLESILQVPGVGGIFIGPLDLATSMGYPGDPSAPEVQQAMSRILAACKRRGIPCGVPANAGNLKQRIEEGYQVFLLDAEKIPADAAAALQSIGRQ